MPYKFFLAKWFCRAKMTKNGYRNGSVVLTMSLLSPIFNMMFDMFWMCNEDISNEIVHPSNKIVYLSNKIAYPLNETVHQIVYSLTDTCNPGSRMCANLRKTSEHNYIKNRTVDQRYCWWFMNHSSCCIGSAGGQFSTTALVYIRISLTHSFRIGVGYEESGAVMGTSAQWGAVGLRVLWAGLGAGIRVLERRKGGL